MSITPQDLLQLITLNDQFKTPELVKEYEALQKDAQFTKIFSFTSSLIHYSPYYIIDLHNKGFEIEMLQILQKAEPEQVNPIIGLIVGLLDDFSYYVSSKQVLEQSLTLLSPSDGKIQSNIHSTLVYCLNTTIDSCAARPRAFVSLDHDAPFVEITLNTRSLPEDKLSVSMWIYLPESLPEDFCTNMFTIRSEGHDLVKFTIMNNEVYRGDWRSPNFSKLTGIRVPEGQWNFVTVDFERGQNSIITSAEIKGNKSEIFQLPLEALSGEEICLQFGGQHKFVPHWPLLGPICINSQRDEQSIKTINQNGPRIPITHPNAYYVLPTFGDKDELDLQTTNSTTISAKIVGDNKPKLYRSALDVLIEFCGVQTLLPLYSMIDKYCENPADISGFMVVLIEIIMKILMCSKLARDQFLKVSGFSIIAQFLLKQRHQNLTYDFYKKCYSLYQKIENPAFRKQILNNIILNFGLWAHSTDENCKLVSRHWSRVVYTDNMAEALEAVSYDMILAGMRTYFWYTEAKGEKCEYGANSTNPRSPDLNIKVIRSNIIQTLYNIAITEFKAEYLTSLIGHCISLSDVQQINDIIVLIKLLAMAETQPYQTITDKLDQFNILHHLLNNENSDLFFNVLEIFAALHVTNSMTSIKPRVHANLLMELIPQVFFNMDIFSLIVPLTMKYPEFSSLMFYMIMNINDDKCIDLVKKHIKPDFEYGAKKNWVLWPTISALAKGGEYADFAIDLIANSVEFDWAFTFSTIDVVGRALGISYEHYKGMYLNCLCKRLLANPLLKFDLQHDFWDLATFFIFMRPEDSEYSVTKVTLDKSVFNFDVIPNIKKTVAEQVTKSSIMHKIEEMGNLPPQKYQYGLRLDKNGKWLDADLAINLIKQAVRTKSETFHNTSCILAAFAIQDKEFEAYECITTLLSMKIATEPALALIQHRDKRHNGPQTNTDVIEKLIQTHEKYYTTLATFPVEVAQKFGRFEEKSIAAKNIIFSMNENDVSSVTMNQMEEYINSVTTLKWHYQRHADRLLSYVTHDGAPWYKEEEKTENEEICISRTSSRNFIPMEIEHIKAVDYGQPVNTDKEYDDATEEFKKKRKAFYSQKTDRSVPDEVKVVDMRKYALPGTLYHIDETKEDIILYINEKNMELQFVEANYALTFDDSNTKKVMYREIKGLPIGLEIFTTSRLSYLISINDFNSLTILRRIALLPGFNNIEVMTKLPHDWINEKKLTDRWINYELTTFDYLCILNDYAGRSFNMASIYPVFPNVNTEATEKYNKRSTLRILGTVEPYKGALAKISGGKQDEKVIKDVNEIRTFYPPELYSSGVCLSKDVKLPEGCNSVLDFVKKNVDKLDFADEVVVSFLDEVFGVNSYFKSFIEFDDEFINNVEKRVDHEVNLEFKENKPIRLFYWPHPRRPPMEISIPRKIRCPFPLFNSTIIVNETKVSGCYVSAVAFENNQQLKRIVVAKGEDKLPKIVVTELPLKLELGKLGSSMIADIIHKRTVIGNRFGEIFEVNGDEKLLEVGSYFDQPIKMLVAGSEHIASVHDSNVICVWASRNPYKFLYLLPSYRGNVTACYIDSEASTMVVGIDDKSIDVFSLTQGKVLTTIKMDFAPTKLSIAGYAQLIVATDGNKICTFDMEGHKINEREFSANIQWIGCSKRHIALTLDKKNVNVIDVHSLAGIEPLITCDVDIRDVFYASTPNCLTVLTSAGEFIVLHFPN